MKYLLFVLFAITCSCQDKNPHINNAENISYNTDSLTYYYNQYKKDSTIGNQTKFIKYFPKNFNEFYKIFGWNEKEDKPTYLYNESYEYIDTYFKILSKNKKYDSALRLCINGFWQADGVNFLQSNMLSLMEKDTQGVVMRLKKYKYDEQKSIWMFLLDAPYKKNNLANLFQKVKKIDITSYNLAYTLWDKEIVYEKNDASTIILDSLIADINNDKIADKIFIKANENENIVFGDDYFKNIDKYRRTLNILISSTQNKYTQITNNKFIPCLRCNEPMDSYSDFHLVNSQTLSIKIVQKANEMIYELLFVWKENNFYLTETQSSGFYDNSIKKYKITNKIGIDKFDYEKISDYIHKTYIIQDPDGFTNLRKEKNITSEVLQKIKSGERINVLDNSGDWFLVKTKEGNQGYVHKSRIKN